MNNESKRNSVPEFFLMYLYINSVGGEIIVWKLNLICIFFKLFCNVSKCSSEDYNLIFYCCSCCCNVIELFLNPSISLFPSIMWWYFTSVMYIISLKIQWKIHFLSFHKFLIKYLSLLQVVFHFTNPLL